MARKQKASMMRWVEESTPIIPELLTLGYQKYAEAFPIPLHHHDSCYEFVYLEHGNVTWEVGDILYPTKAGQWFYTSPQELHKARFDHLEPSRIWWFILKDPRADQKWLNLQADEREYFIDRISQLPRIFQAEQRVSDQLLRLKATVETNGLHQAMFVRHQLLDILMGFLHVIPAISYESGLKDAVIHTVNQIVQTPELRFSVGDMAKAVQVSESHFYKLFHSIYGQSPAAYMMHIRMEHACTLLKAHVTITEVAHLLGFATSQHFTTVFKKTIGSSPSEWRKLMKL